MRAVEKLRKGECMHTAIPIIIEGRFQVFQRFSSSKLVLKTVESCFVALNYYGNGSTNMTVMDTSARES
jgi:hypothetical protein